MDILNSIPSFANWVVQKNPSPRDANVRAHNWRYNMVQYSMQMKFFRFEEAWAKEVKAVRKSFLRPSKMVHRKPNDQVCQKIKEYRKQ
jgi:hypothetical protein